MSDLLPPGLSEKASEFDLGSGAKENHIDFVQAERNRLRAGLLDTGEVASSADPRLASLEPTPSPLLEAVTARKLLRFKDLWQTRHQDLLARVPLGTGLVIDLGTGLYVTGKTRHEASDRFEALFGTSRTALSQEVGIPLTLGSGLWALQSEE